LCVGRRAMLNRGQWSEKPFEPPACFLHPGRGTKKWAQQQSEV